MSDELKELIRNEGKILWVYLSKSIKNDPEEEDKTETVFNPIPIRGLISDLTSSQMQWKTSGTQETQGKEIIINKKYRNTIEQAYKIKIGDDYYVGWKDNQGRTQIREEGDYIRLYVYRK
jgi:hypothetical protein